MKPKAFLLAALLVVSCGQRQPEDWVDPIVLENDVTAAVARQLLQESSAFVKPDAPVCFVMGKHAKEGRLPGASRIFTDRFVDSGRPLILEQNLAVDRATKTVVVRGTVTSPCIIQIARMEKEGNDSYLVEGAWLCRKDIVAKEFTVKGTPGSGQPLIVTEKKLLREEHPPPPPTLVPKP